MIVMLRRPQGVLSMEQEAVAAADRRATAAAQAGARGHRPALQPSPFVIPPAPRRPRRLRMGAYRAAALGGAPDAAHSFPVQPPWVRCYRCRVMEETYHFGLCGHRCVCDACVRFLLGEPSNNVRFVNCLDCGQRTAEDMILEV